MCAYVPSDRPTDRAYGSSHHFPKLFSVLLFFRMLLAYKYYQTVDFHVRNECGATIHPLRMMYVNGKEWWSDGGGGDEQTNKPLNETNEKKKQKEKKKKRQHTYTHRQ